MDIHGNSTCGLVHSVIIHIWPFNGHELNIVNLYVTYHFQFMVFKSHTCFSRESNADIFLLCACCFLLFILSGLLSFTAAR